MAEHLTEAQYSRSLAHDVSVCASLILSASFTLTFLFVSVDCAGCGAEIKQGQSLLALEKQWHVSCFRCRTCNMVLTGEYISK